MSFEVTFGNHFPQSNTNANHCFHTHHHSGIQEHINLGPYEIAKRHIRQLFDGMARSYDSSVFEEKIKALSVKNLDSLKLTAVDRCKSQIEECEVTSLKTSCIVALIGLLAFVIISLHQNNFNPFRRLLSAHQTPNGPEIAAQLSLLLSLSGIVNALSQPYRKKRQEEMIANAQTILGFVESDLQEARSKKT